MTRNNKSKAGRSQSIDDKLVFEGIFYVLRIGILWRYLPKEYRAWQMVYKLFARWTKSGAMEKLLQIFRENADNELLAINSNYIKVHKQGSVLKTGQKNKA